MENQPKKVFQFRAFVSLLTVFSFIMVVLTGCVLFVLPPGRIANRGDWTLWGFSKHQWIAQHIWFCVLFIVSCLVHLYLNFRPLLQYLTNTAAKSYRFRFEWLAALTVCGLLFAGTYSRLKPFSWLLNYQDQVRFSWQPSGEAAPSGGRQGQGIGRLTLSQFCEEYDLNVNTSLQLLKEQGIDARPELTIRQIADQHQMHPSRLREILLPND